jgi:hypothetical protein
MAIIRTLAWDPQVPRRAVAGLPDADAATYVAKIRGGAERLLCFRQSATGNGGTACLTPLLTRITT